MMYNQYELTIVRVITSRHKYRGKKIIVIRTIRLLHVTCTFCVFAFGNLSVQTLVWHVLL